MKNISFIIFCLISIIFLANGVSQAEDAVNSIEWETYRNEAYGFQVNYPKDWKLSFNEDSDSGFFYLAIEASSGVLKGTGRQLPAALVRGFGDEESGGGCSGLLPDARRQHRGCLVAGQQMAGLLQGAAE